MGFVCLELVPMKEPPKPLHPQSYYGSLAIVFLISIHASLSNYFKTFIR